MVGHEKFRLKFDDFRFDQKTLSLDLSHMTDEEKPKLAKLLITQFLRSYILNKEHKLKRKFTWGCKVKGKTISVRVTEVK